MANPTSSVDPPPLEVLPWLKTLPMAPEYHPTLAEFQDPIAYIHKIEKEASQYGICKIVPPVPPASKKTATSNLNRSFAALQQNLGGGSGSVGGGSSQKKGAPTFTTRQQQIGFCPRRPRPVQKPVWQSGEQYTLQQFEAKAKQFERAHAKKVVGTGGGGGNARKGGNGGGGAGGPALSPLEVETIFWKACADKPFSVEYANDMPGSGFAPLPAGKKWREGEASNVGETAWNMRGVSRAKGSLLKFMKEEIPGVTSPMVYVAMMFSWFAWHVEDHELHSLNYLHMGAGKTWYGVPRDAELAFEEVVRVHGYGGEANSLVTFAILGEKTTVMSPEVLIAAGIPCCRLVQNAGEFVVTFPGSYHSGFSLGFNCGEAANIATPEWLRVAKEAAIRRASINYPPMVSHYQLLYELALSLSSRAPISSSSEPRSSRLKDKMKSEGELMIKELFVESVMQNNGMLHVLLEKGSSCIVLPHNTFDISLATCSRARSQKIRPRLSLGLCSREEALKASRSLLPDDSIVEQNSGLKHLNGFCSVKGKFISVSEARKLPFEECNKNVIINSYTAANLQSIDPEKESALESDGLLDQGLLSCVTCGILSFACVAVVQPTDAAARYLMSADCSSFNNLYIGSREKSDADDFEDAKGHNCNLRASPGSKHVQMADFIPDAEAKKKCPSALDLLASAYGDSSDCEEDLPSEEPACADENATGFHSGSNPAQHSLFSHGASSPDAHLDEAEAQSEKELYFTRVGTDAGRSPSHPSCGRTSHPEIVECNMSSSDICQDSSANFAGVCQQRSAASMRDVSENIEKMENSNTEIGSDLTGPAFLLNSLRSSTPTEDNYGDLDNIHFSVKDAKLHQGVGQIKKIDPESSYFAANSRTPTGDLSAFSQISNFNPSVSYVQKSDKDSSRMHIFCLEHALEVEKQLHQIGGAHLMLLCHPDYPKIENDAKALAEELGINYSWREIHFREANKEDEQRIRAALEDEEAMPMNSDWAVKLGINLYYSANLSKSPLYSKQLPYNAVIYKAFGRDSSGGSPGKLKVYGKRRGRQKKIVVSGKWCGKVWMSNQVHPCLAHKDDTQEEEHIDKLDLEFSDKKVLVETDVDSQKQVMPTKRKCSSSITPGGRKSDKKGKRSLVKSSAKRTRYTATADASTAMKDSGEDSPVQSGRILRSSMTKPSQSFPQSSKEHASERSRLNLKDDAGGWPSRRLRKRTTMSEGIKMKADGEKQVKKVKKQPVSSPEIEADDGDYPCNIEGCSMSFNSKHDLILHKRNICPVKGCGKKFFSHKYLVHHRRVHMDDRPLKCPWKGCKMTFKWAWARTEHIRVHTGARPYVCKEAGCGQTFRFVSDFSRHKRKTGHVSKKGRG